MAQVWLITGSARGLGRAIAEAVLAADDKLIATARNPQQLSDLVERYGDNVRAVALDVTDERAAIAAVQLAVDVFGRLDVLVNNAGYGNLAAIEDTTIQDFRAQLETNLFGVVNLTKAAIPVMRRQGAGRILQFSSVGGRVGPIGRGAYAAAKWGVEGFSEVLAKEVGPLGIKVTIIEPGGFRTDFAGSSQTILADNPAYASTVGAVARFQRGYDGAQPGDPKKAAAAVLNIARLDEPPMRLLLGRDAVRAAAEAERTRAEADRKWRSLSESTDFIDDAGQTSNPASQSSSTGGRADLKSRTWLITGASSGLGYALAEFVLQRGDRVVLAARSMNSMSGLAARYPDRALAIGLDVTQPQQRIAAVERAQAHFGGIDVLVNNAGIDFLGAVEEQREEDYRAQFEVTFGAVAMLRSLLGTSYSSRQMGYDLRRLTRKGLVTRLDHQRRCVLTPFGQRVALFSHQGPRPHPASGTPGARPEFHRAGAAILRTTFPLPRVAGPPLDPRKEATSRRSSTQPPNRFALPAGTLRKDMPTTSTLVS